MGFRIKGYDKITLSSEFSADHMANSKVNMRHLSSYVATRQLPGTCRILALKTTNPILATP